MVHNIDFCAARMGKYFACCTRPTPLLPSFHRQSLRALLQVCAAAAAKPMWQLRGGRLVHLRDGCFLQAAPEQLGSAALDIIQSTMPVFDAPWHVKEALEAAGVPQLTSTTPGRVRSTPASQQPSVQQLYACKQHYGFCVVV